MTKPKAKRGRPKRGEVEVELEVEVEATEYNSRRVVVLWGKGETRIAGYVQILLYCRTPGQLLKGEVV